MAIDALPYAESGWERSVAMPRSLDLLVESARRRWSHLADATPQVLGRGLRSLNLRFGDEVVRVSLTTEHDLAKEAALLRAFNGVVRVPRVLDADANALRLEFVPHEELPSTPTAASAVGRAAARIHARTFDRAGFLDADLRIPEPFPDAWTGLVEWAGRSLRGAAGRRLGDLGDRMRAAWSAHEKLLRDACARPALVHADFKPANVKWLPREEDVLVLDWEFAWSGPPLMDLGQFLRWGAPPSFVDAFARSYVEAGGSLPSEWRRTAALIDLFNLVGFLDHEDIRPRRDDDVLRRIRETVSEASS